MTPASPSASHDSPPALRMADISKRFGPVQALSNVSFSVRRGTVHALVGENGAGKSTLMKVLAGVYIPDGGSIEVGGRRLDMRNPGQAIAAGISMIYQELDLAEDLSVAENIYMGAEPRGLVPLSVDRAKMNADTESLARRYGFAISPTAPVSSLSTGDCQIVEILKALRRNSSLIVMDEPTSSLGEEEAARLLRIVRDLRGLGISIVYISHRLEEIVGIADDITVLRDGQVVHTGSAGRLDIPGIVHHMVGRELSEFFPPRKATVGEVLFAAEGVSCGNEARDVSFEVRRGEIVGMAGLVGAGRTALAQAIFGAAPRTAGKLTIHGKEMDIRRPADAIAGRIALLTEDRKRTGLCLILPCSWNITLPSLLKLGFKHMIRLARERKVAAEAAGRMQIKWSGPDAPAESLSGGNQQKVCIARWLLAESDFLIFDEPTRGIDVGAKREIYGLLNGLAESGKAILFISSELPELFGVTDRILVMRRGRLVANLVTRETTPEAVMHMAAVETD